MEVLPNGSLKKRCGYSKLGTLSDKPKAIWTGRLDGADVALILAGKTLYTFDFSKNSFTNTRNIGTAKDKADFFTFDGGIYLLDGSKIYEVSHGDLRTPYGYVPLIGKDWPDSTIGAPYEPRNLLNDKGRISYIVSENNTAFFKTDTPISSVYAVLVNGSAIDSSRYAMTAMPRTIGVSDLSVGDRVEIYFTYPSYIDMTTYNNLIASTSGVIFGGVSNSRPFLWGSKNGEIMYSARHVSQEQYRAAKKGFPASDSLYFPTGCDFKAGDGRNAITAVSRHYDRLLMFTEDSAWMAESSDTDTENVPTLNINSSYGAFVPKGAAVLRNNPYTISAEGIIEWSSNTDEHDECNAKSISGPIANKLPRDVYTSGVIFADNRANRLLVTSPSLNGIVWVWYAEPNAWVRFDLGVTVDRFFETPNGIGFASGTMLYGFDEKNYQDFGGREIIGKFKGNSTDFDKFGKKRIFSAAISCDGEVVLDCSLDDDTTAAVSLTMSAHGHESIRRKINARRFTTLRPSITASGSERQVIHSLKLWAG